jgi:hypothetical protein
MIIPRLGYDVRKGSRRAGPPDVEIPPDDAEEDAGYSCIEGTCEMPTIAPSGDSSRTTV